MSELLITKLKRVLFLFIYLLTENFSDHMIALWMCFSAADIDIPDEEEDEEAIIEQRRLARKVFEQVWSLFRHRVDIQLSLSIKSFILEVS